MEEYVDSFYYTHNGRAVSLEIVESGDGYAAEWWVSGKYVTGALVIGYMSMPVFGSTPEEALRVARRSAEAVAQFFDDNSSGLGAPSGHASDFHVQTHLTLHRPHISTFPRLGATAVYYDLLSGFRVHNPAVVIQREMGVGSVRTVHDRIFQARKLGMIESYGQGRAHR